MLFRSALRSDRDGRERLEDARRRGARREPLDGFRQLDETESLARVAVAVAAHPARPAQAHADVALLDIRMPGMDGIETAQHLRKLEHPPAIIFTTAYDAYAVKAFEVHAIDYLLKPIRAAACSKP